jgi:tetratricopeptide (TPR) repeat protein
MKVGKRIKLPKGRQKMTSIPKISVLFLVIVALLCGCNRKTAKKTDEIELTGTSGRKAKLLSKIERRYESPSSHYKLGKLYYEDGLWNKAEWEFNVALGFDPFNHPAQAAIVKTLIAAKQEERSKLMAEIYMNQAATSAKSSLLLGQAFQKELLDDYALSCYRQALGLAPTSASLHRQIGYYYLSKGDTVRAEDSLRRSFQLNPYQAEVAGELGRLGVIVQIPRKTTKNTKNLDRLLDKKK